MRVPFRFRGGFPECRGWVSSASLTVRGRAACNIGYYFGSLLGPPIFGNSHMLNAALQVFPLVFRLAIPSMHCVCFWAQFPKCLASEFLCLFPVLPLALHVLKIFASDAPPVCVLLHSCRSQALPDPCKSLVRLETHLLAEPGSLEGLTPGFSHLKLR